jgi:hypothetical protein
MEVLQEENPILAESLTKNNIFNVVKKSFFCLDNFTDEGIFYLENNF